MEHSGKQKKICELSDDLPLFASLKPKAEKQETPIENELKNINPDELTPKQALEELYKLKNLLK